MNTQFATNEWGQSPPFQPNNAPRPSTAMSALSKGSSTAHRNSGSDAAMGGAFSSTDNYDAMAYVADSLGGAQGAVTAATAAAGGGGGGGAYTSALMKSAAATSAVATTYPSANLRQTPFSGLYEDVEFPVHTLFSPPRPPGEQLPRARRPNKSKAPVFATDVARAGTREHNAQREVSRVWRGVLCRRRLRQAHALEEFLNDSARRIQCWWRGLLAKWRRRQLQQIRSEWAKERTAQYVAERVLNTTNVIYWQHGKFEGAALRIQRLVRWYLRDKERRQCAATGVPEAEWPPVLVRPTAERHKPYFPWRHRHTARTTPIKPGALVAASTDVALAGDDDFVAPTAPRTLLQFRETPREVAPPTQAEVEEINAKMRVTQAQRAAALQTPEALSRQEWKTEGMRQEDLDFNAGIVQRLYRSKRAPETVHTKELTAAYFNKAARVIARTFRMYVLIKRMRGHRADVLAAVKAKIAARDQAKIADLKTEAVWQKDLMDAAATSIQRCWAWYRYRHDGTVSEAYRASGTLPTPPCYGLLQAHIAREHALRWSTMNLLEQRQYEEQRQHKYLRYVPKQVAVYEHTGFLFIQPPKKSSASAPASKKVSTSA